MTTATIHPAFAAAMASLDTPARRQKWEAKARAATRIDHPADFWDGTWQREIRDIASVAEMWIDIWVKSTPTRFRDAALADLTPEQEPDVLRRWLADDTAATLMIAGPPGRGKTHAAYALAHEAAGWAALGGPRKMPRAWTVPGFLDSLRPSAASPDATWEAAKTAPLVLLDDLANVRTTDWSVERIWLLADARTSNDLRTIITTNAGWTDLESTWGVPTMDRWRDRSVVVKFAGESRRGPAW